MKRLVWILAATALLAPAAARAEGVTLMRARLPEPRGDGFAHATGHEILVNFGSVLTYRPREDAFVATQPAFPPPGPPVGSASAWTGRALYTFGGSQCDTFACSSTDRIHRVDPRTDTATLMTARLPRALSLASAVWSGLYAYIFGGYACDDDGCGPTGGIYRYDPRGDEVERMDAVLPGPRGAMYSVWAPIPTATCPTGCAYVFGGCCDADDEIVRYEPLSDTVTVATAFPSDGAGGRWSAPAVWSGRYAYVFGGVTCPVPGEECRHTDEIVRFDPLTGEARTERARLPQPRGGMASAWFRGAAYLIGGVYCEDPACVEYDEVWRYRPGLPDP